MYREYGTSCQNPVLLAKQEKDYSKSLFIGYGTTVIQMA
jgi:hypothetical protein